MCLYRTFPHWTISLGSAVASEVPEPQTWFLSFPHQWLLRQEVLTQPSESALGNPEKPFSLQSSFGFDKAAIRIDQHGNSTTVHIIPASLQVQNYQGKAQEPNLSFSTTSHHTTPL